MHDVLRKRMSIHHSYVFIILPVEDELVSIRFTEGNKLHSLPWVELLDVNNETPLESLDELTNGMRVLAAWYTQILGQSSMLKPLLLLILITHQYKEPVHTSDQLLFALAKPFS